MKILVNPTESILILEQDPNHPQYYEEQKKINKLQTSLAFSKPTYKKPFKGTSGGFTTETIQVLKVLMNKNGYYSFLTGFLPEIKTAYKDAGFSTPLEIEYTYIAVPENIGSICLQTALREYQITAVASVLMGGSGLIDGCVGSGKTTCMAAILDALRAYPAIILVPSLTLLEQVKQEFKKLLNEYGILSVKEYMKNNNNCNALIGLPIHFRNVPTDVLQQFPVFIMDEAHQSVASIAMDTIMRQNAPYKFGFTATTKGRSDGRDKFITGIFGNIVNAGNYETLVQDGYVPKIQVELHYASWEDDYVYMEDTLIVYNKRRHAIIEKIVKRHMKVTKKPLILILCRRIEHVLELQKIFPLAAIVTGEMKNDERKNVIDEIRELKYNIVIASSVFFQGISIPEFTMGINAAGGKSSILSEQKSGRMARGDIDRVKLWVDLYDNYTYTLERHSEDRLDVYNELYGAPELFNFPDSKYKKLKNKLFEKKYVSN